MFSGNLISQEYTSKCLEMVAAHASFAFGVVSQSRLSSEPALMQFTPGVHLAQAGDQLGQQYVSPRQAVLDKGADVVIVGRGITAAKEPQTAAAEYQQEAWRAYLERIM